MMKKMNKPLLQYKREIEEKIRELKIRSIYLENSDCDVTYLIGINIGTLNQLENQLQMIDDIIEQQQENMKSLKNYEFDDYYDVKWNYYEQQCIADYINTFIL